MTETHPGSQSVLLILLLQLFSRDANPHFALLAETTDLKWSKLTKHDHHRVSTTRTAE